MLQVCNSELKKNYIYIYIMSNDYLKDVHKLFYGAFVYSPSELMDEGYLKMVVMMGVVHWVSVIRQVRMSHSIMYGHNLAPERHLEVSVVKGNF